MAAVRRIDVWKAAGAPLYLYYGSAGYQTNLIKRHLIQRTHTDAEAWHRYKCVTPAWQRTGAVLQLCRRDREGRRIEKPRMCSKSLSKNASKEENG